MTTSPAPTKVEYIGDIDAASDHIPVRHKKSSDAGRRRHSSNSIDPSALSNLNVKSILKKTSSYTRLGDPQRESTEEKPRRHRRTRKTREAKAMEETPLRPYRRKVSFNSVSVATAERWTHQGSLSTGNLNSLVMPSRPSRRSSNDGEGSPQQVKSNSLKNLEDLLSMYSTPPEVVTPTKASGADGPGQGNFVWGTTGAKQIPALPKGNGQVTTKKPMSTKDAETLRKLLNVVSIRKPSRRTSMDHEDPALISSRSSPELKYNVFEAKSAVFVHETMALSVSNNSLASTSA